MKITIIYETIKKGTTYHYVKLLLNRLKANINIETEEFILQNNLQKIYNNKKNPHYSEDDSFLTQSLHNSDIIVFACNDYSYNSIFELEYFINTINFNKISSLNSVANAKIGLILSSDKMRLHVANKRINSFLKSLGVTKIFSLNYYISSLSSTNIDWSTKQRINNKISVMANKILNHIQKVDNPTYFSYIKSIFSPTPSFKQATNYSVVNLNFQKKHPIINAHFL